MNKNQAYFQALIWVLTPSICIFLIALVVSLSFEKTKELFLGYDYYPFRIFLVVIEIIFYILLVCYYQEKIKEKYNKDPERFNEKTSLFTLLQDKGDYTRARESITDKLYSIHRNENHTPHFRVSHREEGNFNYYIVETIKQ